MQAKFHVNDLTCECSHPKADHMHKAGEGATFCSSNQKLCDCWSYTMRKDIKRSNVVFQQQFVLPVVSVSKEVGKYDMEFARAVANLNTIGR